MSATAGARVNQRFGAGAFVSGLAFIVAATVLNIAYDRMTDFKLETLPFYIGTLYATTGKMGVTLLLVTLGMVCLVLGIYIRSGQPVPLDSTGSRVFTTGPSSSDFYTAGSTPTAAPVGGRVVLETWKYLTPPNGSPGGP